MGHRFIRREAEGGELGQGRRQRLRSGLRRPHRPGRDPRRSPGSLLALGPAGAVVVVKLEVGETETNSGAPGWTSGWRVEDLATKASLDPGRRGWERRTSPALGDAAAGRRPRLGGRRRAGGAPAELYICWLLGACWAGGHFCWAGMAVPLGGHCFLAWAAQGSLVWGAHVS